MHPQSSLPFQPRTRAVSVCLVLGIGGLVAGLLTGSPDDSPALTQTRTDTAMSQSPAPTMPSALPSEPTEGPTTSLPTTSDSPSSGRTSTSRPPTAAPRPSVPSVAGAPAWPLTVSSNKRYLTDNSGRAFFMVADTGWNMFGGISVQAAKQYMDIRKSQGYNTIMASLLFHHYTEDTTRGKAFDNDNIASPNSSWWQGVDEEVRYAQSKGITLLVNPFWAANHGGWGDGGSTQGLSEDEVATYGRFLGQRYKDASNVIWFIGGDDDNAKYIDQADILGPAIRSAHPSAVITYHNQGNSPEMQSRSWHSFYSFQWNSNGAPWPYDLVAEHRGWAPTKPVLDMEPAYDPKACCGSDMDTSLQENRRSGWWVALSGALGVVYGGPASIWNMGPDSDGQLATDDLQRQGARETAMVGAVLQRYRWASLVPDTNGSVVTGDRGGDDTYVVAARSSDGSLIMAYTPVQRSLTVDLSKLSGPGTAQWVNPSTGQNVGHAESVGHSGTRSFASPLDEDAVLVITAG